jgi:hypothetical protein
MSFEFEKVVRYESDGSRIIHVTEILDERKFAGERMKSMADHLVDASHQHMRALADAMLSIHAGTDLNQHEIIAKRIAKATGDAIRAPKGSAIEQMAASIRGRDGVSSREFVESIGGYHFDRSPKKSRDEMLFAESISY